MIEADYNDFVGVIDDLCIASNRPCSDDVRRVFWETLKPHSLRSVRDRAKYLLATRKASDRFPTPGDLAPQAALCRPDSDADRAYADKRERQERETWDRWFKTDPEEARLQLILAKCGRLRSTEHPGTQAFAEMEQQEWRAHQELMALWERRRKQSGGARAA